MHPAARSLASALAFAAVFLATLAAVEGACLLVNGRVGAARPFLFDTQRLWDPPEGRRLSFVDPLLGAAYNPDALGGRTDRYHHGFFVTGDPEAAASLRIVALGGSTTEESEGCWPAALHGLLAEAGVPAVVFNGGISGACSDQEVLKLVRDALSLRPDLVIAYNGVNDVAEGPDLLDFPRGAGYTHVMHERLMDLALNGANPWLLPNTLSLVRRTLASTGVEGIERGVPRNMTPAAAWARNVHVMKSVCDGFGIRYLDVLQPVLGIGSYRPTADEARRVGQTESCRKDYPSFYPEARALAAASGGVTLDLTEVFSGMEDVYRDWCHVQPAGNLAVAKAIVAELKARTWLERPVALPAGAPN